MEIHGDRIEAQKNYRLPFRLMPPMNRHSEPPAFNEREVETERRIVLGEVKRKKNSASVVISQLMEACDECRGRPIPSSRFRTAFF